MQDDNQPANRQDVDRGEPLVSRESNASKIAITVFCVAAVMALGYIALKRDKAIPVKKEEETFTVAGKAGTPYIAPPKPVIEPKPTVVEEKSIDRLQPVTVIDMEQRRLIAEEEKLLLERRMSPQLILSADAKSADASTGMSPDASSGTEDDENRSFASRHGSKGPKRMKSNRLGNLSALVTQGTIIPGVLETAISSDLPGSLRAKVAEDVYSFDGKSLLIPRDSKLIGTYRAGVKQGQTRVFVIWQRLLRQDGVEITLDSYGSDALGRSGLDGEVDTHFMERFGSTIMLSMIDGAIQAGVNSANDRNTADVALNSGNDLSRASEIALENSINIRPTIHVDQGARISITIQHDMDFSEEGAQENQVSVFR